MWGVDIVGDELVALRFLINLLSAFEEGQIPPICNILTQGTQKLDSY